MLNIDDIQAAEIIEEPGYSGWNDIDPDERKIGHFYDITGQQHNISMDDEASLTLANQQKVNGIFQFDTPLAKRILEYGVKRFEDLQILNAMGHPGPLQCVHPDTLIQTVSGQQKIKDLTEPILYLSKDGTIKSTTNYKKCKTESKKLVKITLANGNSIKCSAKQEILTNNGFKKAKDLTINDIIKCVINHTT